MEKTGHEAVEEKPLTTTTINNLVRKYAHWASLDGISARSLRHTAAMHVSQKGTIAEVSKFLRHKSVRVTTIYLEHVDIESADRLTNELANNLIQDTDSK
ncbi:MAG: site-specific integrase [Anaerolineae bacterium]|nr:site-specific integrase [Anaerolineae bacterium]